MSQAKIISGKSWVFGDNINTDAMAPGPTMLMEWEQRRPSLFPETPGIALKIEPGDFFIAGENWGCGSSREQAVHNMMKLGVAIILAESFARIFQRNAIANALPVITCPNISRLAEQGDTLSFDWGGFVVTNLRTGDKLQGMKYNNMMGQIVEAGGMMAVLKKRFGAREGSSLE